MEIINSTDFQLNKDSAVTIGKFDGVHRGHRLIIDKILEKKKEGLNATIFTFDPSPIEFFSGKTVPGLTTREEKRRIFSYLGVDTLIEYPLTKESAAIEPEVYIKEVLCKQMKMKYIAAGEDLSFGYMGKGNSALINRMSKDLSYETEIIGKLLENGEEVSSTLIRDLVSKGEMEKAEKLIGVPYAVYGTVTHGRALGRKMGFPTVNVEIDQSKLMPPFGVYFTEVSIDGRHFNGITNIGCKPTVTDSATVFAETNILDFNEDVYDRQITVKLKHFSRSEQKFGSIEELKNRIAIDIEEGHKYFDKCFT